MPLAPQMPSHSSHCDSMQGSRDKQSSSRQVHLEPRVARYICADFSMASCLLQGDSICMMHACRERMAINNLPSIGQSCLSVHNATLQQTDERLQTAQNMDQIHSSSHKLRVQTGHYRSGAGHERTCCLFNSANASSTPCCIAPSLVT